MYKQKEIKECDKFINRYILRARKFIEYACFQYGKYNYAISQTPSADFISDFQYFVTLLICFNKVVFPVPAAP